MYGRDPNLPIDSTLVPQLETEADTDIAIYRKSLIENFEHCRRVAAENTRKAQLNHKDHYDLRMKKKYYEPGDRVFLYTPALKKGQKVKFAHLYRGPFRVARKLSDWNYEIIPLNQPNGRPQIVHHDRMKPEMDVKIRPQEWRDPALDTPGFETEEIEDESAIEINTTKQINNLRLTRYHRASRTRRLCTLLNLNLNVIFLWNLLFTLLVFHRSSALKDQAPKMEKLPSPLPLFCSAATKKFRYLLPAPIPCSLEPIPESFAETKRAEITLYIENVFQYKTEAWKCSQVSFTEYRFTNFIGQSIEPTRTVQEVSVPESLSIKW